MLGFSGSVQEALVFTGTGSRIRSDLAAVAKIAGLAGFTNDSQAMLGIEKMIRDINNVNDIMKNRISLTNPETLDRLNNLIDTIEKEWTKMANTLEANPSIDQGLLAAARKRIDPEFGPMKKEVEKHIDKYTKGQERMPEPTNAGPSHIMPHGR